MPTGDANKPFRLGIWLVQPDLNRLSDGDRVVVLEPRLMDVLTCLANRPGKIVSTDDLLETVWHGRVLVDNTIYQAVAHLRKLLGDDVHDPRYIETIAKKGYRLICTVTPDEPKYVESIPKRDDRVVTTVSHVPERRPDGSDTMASTWLFGTASVGVRALVAVTLVVAAAFWMIALAVRGGANDIQPMVSLAVMSAESGSADASEKLRPISDRLVTRLVSLNGIEIATADVPVLGGESLTPFADAGRALGVNAVLVFRADTAGSITLDVIDPESETLRASIPVDMSVSDSNAATDALIVRLGQELELPGNWLRSLEGNQLDAREQEALGRYYMQRRHSEFADTPYRLLVLQQSVAAFRSAVDADPTYVDGWTGLSLASTLRYWYEGDETVRKLSRDEGRDAIEQALALDPDSSDAYLAMGMIHWFEGGALMARAAYKRSLELDPDNPMALRAMSMMLTKLGEFRLAASYARRGAELVPFSIEYLSAAAAASFNISDHDQAIRFIEAQLEIVPALPFALNNLIVFHRDAGQLDEAINLGPRLDRALSLRPNIRMPYLPGMMANLFVQIDLPEESVALIRSAELDYPNDQYTYWARSSYLLATGNVEAAQAHILDWPVSPNFANLVAAHATMAGLYDYALQVLDQMTDANDQWPTANPFLDVGKWLTLEYLQLAALPAVYKAYAESRAGNHAAADALLANTMEFLNYWIERNVQISDALYFRAAVHGLQGRPDEGVADLAAAVDVGYRYAWRIRIDPVLGELREHPNFAAIIGKLEDELSQQRARIIVGTTRIAAVRQ